MIVLKKIFELVESRRLDMAWPEKVIF